MTDTPVFGPPAYDPIFGPAIPTTHRCCSQCYLLEERLESARAHIRYLEATFCPKPCTGGEPFGQLPEVA